MWTPSHKSHMDVNLPTNMMCSFSREGATAYTSPNQHIRAKTDTAIVL